MKKNESVRAAACLTAMLAVAACDDGTGVAGPGDVALNFRVATGVVAATASPGPAPSPSLVAGPPMSLTGSNGTLTITEIRLIVAEVELDGLDDSCDDDVGPGDDCADFEAPPRFLDLPLDGVPIEAFVSMIPAGTYKELEFEIEDLEDDETDPVLASQIADVRSDILAEFPDWPDKASGLVVGAFEPAAGGSIDFRVYLDGEVEVEMDLMPLLVVADDGTSSRTLTVDVRPDIWFGQGDGSILPLHLWDFDLTGELLELEVEMEDGFTEVEVDD